MPKCRSVWNKHINYDCVSLNSTHPSAIPKVIYSTVNRNDNWYSTHFGKYALVDKQTLTGNICLEIQTLVAVSVCPDNSKMKIR